MTTRKTYSRTLLAASAVAFTFGIVNGARYLLFRDASQPLDVGRAFGYGSHVVFGALCAVIADCLIKLEKRIDILESKLLDQK